MQLAVKVFPKSKENSVTERNGGFIIRVTAAPEDGQANKAALRLFAAHLGVAVRQLVIVRGATARHKIIEIRSST